ncbi:MAG: GMC family oxidoreductase [Casimicrobiaceae bacterium]
MAAEERHDYVVVGAGTSGITLAYLLHKHGMDVVVLEAGEDRDHDPNIHDLKSFYGLESHYRNEYFWPENGRPNPRLPADGNHYSGGRLWGGSSSINEAWYWRGSQFIYDRWGGLFSQKAFCTDAFRKLETFHGVSQSPDARGDRGPFDITQGSAHPIGEKFIAALHSVLKDDYGLEVPVVDDMHTVNGPAMSVKAQHFVDLSDKKRVSTSVSLLKKKGCTLAIKSQATALKVLFEGKKAVGVRYLHHGETKTIHANKKVIVCAGLRSAFLLMHSGIGDETLRQYGIPMTHVNPEVGRHLTNHLLLLTKLKVPVADNKDIAEAVHFKGLTAVSAFPDPKRRDLSDIDFELTILSTAPGEAFVACFFVNPESRGHVSVCSGDPLHPVVVDTNYLSAAEDTAKLERALEVVEKVTDRMSATHEGYQRVSDLSDKKSYVRNNAVHVHHWTGTCQIGKVLDEHLDVLGVEHLMVADTSSIPEIVRGHTYAPALLIAAAAFVELTGIRNWDF